MQSKKSTLIYFFLFLTASIFITNSNAQCPGCVIDLPGGMAEDTLFLSEVADKLKDAKNDHSRQRD